MHWLFFDEKSPAKLEEAGFSYDSTSGYNETLGYRAGTSQAFRPPGLAHLLELPMHIMDTALFYPAHMNLSLDEANRVMAELVNNSRRFGGVLTINWHDRSIAPERLWGDAYTKLLKDLREMGAWFPTAAQAVSWFRKRRSAVIEKVERKGATIRLKVSVDNTADELPELRVRAHRPREEQLSHSKQAEAQGQFAETILRHSDQVELALSDCSS
jgi:hypothetical protein